MQNEGSVELSGTLTFRDLLKSQYFLTYRRTWWIILAFMLFSLGGVLLAAIAALLTSDLNLALRNGTPFLLLVVFWLLIVTTPYRGAKSLLKTSTRFSAPITYRFSTQGIHSTSIHSAGDISYEAVWAVRETKSLFFLFLNTASAIMLPKRFFKDPIQQNDWRQLVEQKISPKIIAKPGFFGRWF